MTFSPNGIAILKQCEGFSPVLYPDAGGFSIGYGCYFSPTDAEQWRGKTITEDQAAAMLLERVRLVVDTINAGVVVPLTQNQFDALVIFTYNVGAHAFLTSTLFKLLNQRRYGEAADQFKVWNKSQGHVLPALIARRAKEEALFREIA